MAVTPSNIFQPDAIDANRRGELTDRQFLNFSAASRSRRKSALSSAAFFVAGAVLIGVFASPTAPIVTRAVITLVCLVLATLLAVRAVFGIDALTRDVRQRQVQSVEGGIRKSGPIGGRSTTHFLEVGNRTFKVGQTTSAAAPEAGFVRLYFLPRSRTVVNFERLQPASTGEVTLQDVSQTLGTAMLSHDRGEANAARATLADIADTMAAAFTQSAAAPPPGERDPRPLEEALPGTWTNRLMKVTFAADGTVVMDTFGSQKRGRWSIDSSGRLHSDITGRDGAAEAWVAGSQLTIAVEGEGLTFKRA